MNSFSVMNAQVNFNSLDFLVVKGKKFQCRCLQELCDTDSIASAVSQGVLCPKIH